MVIDFLIRDADKKKVLLQKRSPTRKLYPNRWEIPGGHQEACETVEQTIKRELFEELQCELVSLGPLLHSYLWQDQKTRNDVYMISIRGRPVPESRKVTDLQWFSLDHAREIFEAQIDSDGALMALSLIKKWI